MSFPDDKEILTLISTDATRNDGYRMLVGKYKEKLYWHIRRMVHDHDDADDILQNTFLKVIRHIAGFQEQSSLYTWMYRIASNETLNFLKAGSRTAAPAQAMAMAAATDHHDSPSADMMLDLLARALDTLPDKQRMVFHMRYYDEMPYQQIAEITDTTVGALKASYHHAVKKIEEYIKERA